MENDGWTIIHIRIETKNELSRAKGSRKISFDRYLSGILRMNRQRERRITLRLFPDL